MNETELAVTDTAYETYRAALQARFNDRTKNGKAPLFLTNLAPGALYAAYLSGFKDPEAKQYHTCNTCRAFIERFGALVVIDPATGLTAPALWHAADAPEPYTASVIAMETLVRRASVTGVFLSSADTLGTPITGDWTHFAADLPTGAVCYHPKSHVLSAGQKMAEHLQDFQQMTKALAEFNQTTVQKACVLLRSETLYRSERVLAPAEWLLETQEKMASAVNPRNVLWHRVATAPNGFCHPRNSMIGTLLADVAAGLPFEDVERRFADKMRPGQYQTAQAAPSAGAIVAAEKLFEHMGLAPALPRRYAAVNELPAVWRPSVAPEPSTEPGKLFAHLTPKGEPAAQGDMAIPPAVMTWEKFRRTVLPTASQIEVYVPGQSNRFAALTTAVDPAAPPLLAWDYEDERNPYAWYYADGIDAEIQRRVVSAGGQHTGVDIRASLVWNNRNDLDLHCETPRGEHIYFGNKKSRNCHGWLDVDMNVSGETNEPVENIRWRAGSAPEGFYRFWVENYCFHEHRMDATPFVVELEVGGRVFAFHGETPRGCAHNQSRIDVAHFNYQRGSTVIGGMTLRPAAGASSDAWGLVNGARAPVRAVVESPNLWGSRPQPHQGRHVFFLVDGCADSAAGAGRGFFTETLRAEVRPARAVLEAYAAQAKLAAPLEGAPPACGIGLSAASSASWDLKLRALTPAGWMHVQLDRWD